MLKLRDRKRWGALAVAAVVGTSVVAVHAGLATAAPVEVTGGTIDWGIKDSFRKYVTGKTVPLPDFQGTIGLTGGVSVLGSPVDNDGVFRFAVSGGSRDAEAGSLSAASGGSVRFQSHAGILDMTFSDVRVQISGGVGSVVVDAVSREFIDTTTAGDPITYNDVAIGALDLTGVSPSVSGDTVTYTNVPVTLTSAGVPAFGGFYAADTDLDTITFALNVGDAPGGGDPDPGPSVAGGSLRWVVSGQAWTSSSLQPCYAAGAPATRIDGDYTDPEVGVVFPTADGTFDAATGEAQATFDGSVVFGNIGQGDYRVRLSDLTVTVAADGVGAMTADVDWYKGPTNFGSVCDVATWTSSLGDDVTIVTFTADPGDRVAVGDSVYWSITPPWGDIAAGADDPANSFHPDFIAALSAVQGQNAASHFRATGANQVAKKPGTLHLRFDMPGTEQSAVVDITTTLGDGGALTISVVDTTVELPALQLSSGGTRYQAAGQLGGVLVTDTRGADPGWTVTASITDFDSPDTDDRIAGTGLGWTPVVTNVSDGQTVAPGAAVAPGVGVTGKTLGSAAAGAGVGTATLGAGLTLHAPTTIAAGTYTATLTLTVI